MGAAPGGVVGDISVSTTTTDQAKVGGDVSASNQFSGLGAGPISSTPIWAWVAVGAVAVLAILAAMFWPKKKKGGR